MLHTIDWLIDRAVCCKRKSSTTPSLTVVLLCIARDMSMFTLFEEQFKRYSSLDNASQGVTVELLIYCTGASGSGVNELTSAHSDSNAPSSKRKKTSRTSKRVAPDPSITTKSTTILMSPVIYGRPNIEEVLLQTKQVHASTSVMAVVVCGPSGLVASVQRACFTVQEKYGRSALVLHEESFRF